jgi:23S rRNA-/tRNA-specific pseudouridylate synthase
MEGFQDSILYEDDNRLAVNKPHNTVMHTTNPKDIAIQDYLDVYCKDLKNQTFKPSFGYRLDKDTTGVLIAAKTFPALQFINKIIREREVSKNYIALVAGAFPKHVIIDKALEKKYNEKFGKGQTVVNERYGDRAISECWLEKTVNNPALGEISLIKVKIQT